LLSDTQTLYMLNVF